MTQAITNWFKPVVPSSSSSENISSPEDPESHTVDDIVQYGIVLSRTPLSSRNRKCVKKRRLLDHTGLLKDCRVSAKEDLLQLEEKCKKQKLIFNAEPYLENDLEQNHSEDELLSEIRRKYSLRDIQGDKVSEKEHSFDETEEYEVESIVGYKGNKGRVQYLVKWKDWPESENTWEPAENLLNSYDMIIEFHQKEGQHIPRLSVFKQCLEESVAKKQREMISLITELLKNEDVASLLRLHGTSLSKINVNGTTLKAIAKDLKNLIYNPPKNRKNPPLIVKMLKSENGLNANLLNFVNSRKKIMKRLQEWEQRINLIQGLHCYIKIENFVDLEGPPEQFSYIIDYKAGEGITIPDDPPIGCDCVDCYKDRGKCCAAKSEGAFAYSRNGIMHLPIGTPIYECNKACKCSSDCINRVVQKGSLIKLAIFRTADFRGWGVKTLEKIRKGAFVMEYIGEVITNKEAHNRDSFYDEVGRTYLLDLDYDGDDCPYAVDAAYYGNVSHFMNHSCDPNLAIYGVWINNLDPKLPRIAFFAKRDIKTGEELTFDYHSRTGESSPSHRRSPYHGSQNNNTSSDLHIQTLLSEEDIQYELGLESSPEQMTRRRKRTACRCGAQNCRKFLF